MKNIAKLLANQGLVTSQGIYEMADNFFAQFGDDDTAFVSYHSAPAGFEAFSVMFGDSVPMRLVLKAENALRIEAGADMVTRRQMDGRMVMYFTAPLYPKIGGVFIGGGGTQISPEWLYFTMPEGGTVTLTKNGSPTVITLEYSTDNGSTWTEWTESGGVRTLTLNAGQAMHVRNQSLISTGFSNSNSKYYQFSFVGDCKVGGNINSLLCSDPSLAMLSNYCYSNLFRGCASLTMNDTFTLPATTLANNCYYNMFRGCTSLTMNDTFTLPATILANNCYYNMFSGCTSLTMNDTFTLPATTLANNCYYNMFFNCTSLTMNDTFTLPATILADNCYSSMFSGCTSLIMNDTFTLPATTLANNCYYNMFLDCTHVEVIRTLMTDISASNCLSNWLYNVFATGNFYCPASLNIPSGANGIPNGWTRHDI